MVVIFNPSLSRFFIFGLAGFTPTSWLFWEIYLSPIYREIISKKPSKMDIEQANELFNDGTFIFLMVLSGALFTFLFFMISYVLFSIFVEIFKCIKRNIFSYGGKK